MENRKRTFVRNFGIIALAAVMIFTMASCTMLEALSLMGEAYEAGYYDMQDVGLTEEEKLLVGKWRSDTGHLYTFNDDGTGTIRLSGRNEDQNIRWTTFSDTFIMTMDDGSSRYVTYSLNGDEFTMLPAGAGENERVRTTRERPSLAFTHSSRGCAVSIGTATDKNIVIPATCPQGHPVTAIVASDLNNNTSRFEGGFAGTAITSITIPGSITSISAYAFCDCEYLESVILENGVTTIGDFAFIDSFIKSITIPASVTSIGKYAFSRCFSISSIIIPASVTSIGEGAFSYCGLTSVTFQGIISAAGFNATALGDSRAEGYMGDLREKYLAGGPGTYTSSNQYGGGTWTKQ